MQTFGYVREIQFMKLPEPVILSLQNYLEILDENYGDDRDIYKDLGGYAVIPESVSDVETIKQEIIKGTIPEDVEGQIFCSSLFILSSNYAVIVVTTKALTDLLLVSA